MPLFQAALAIMVATGTEEPKLAPMPVYEDLFKEGNFDFLPPIQRTSINDTAYIIHSSGKLRRFVSLS